MSRRWVRVALAVFTGALALVLMLLAGYAVGLQPAHMRNQHLLDCRMRCNEARCVLKGIDPYDVWKGRVRVAGYEPWNFREAAENHELVPFKNYVHAYPPWSYSIIMPLSFFDDVFATSLWLTLLWGAVAVGTGMAFLFGYRRLNVLWMGFLSIAVVWMFGSAFLSCMFYGNYSVVVAFAVAVALILHRKHLDGWAGVAWSLALVKPQTTLLFLIPLLCLRKWRTLGVLCVLMTGLTLVPCILCHRLPWTMIFSIADYSAGQFFETGFIAQSVFVKLIGEGGLPPALLTMGSAVIGATVCGALTVALSVATRKHNDVLRTVHWDELLVFLPALILSTVWTASRGHDHSIQAVTSVILLCLFARSGVPKVARICALCMIPILVIAPFETAFELPINVFKLLSVFGIVILTTVLIRDSAQDLATFRLDKRIKTFCGRMLTLAIVVVALHGVNSVGKSMDCQPPQVKDQQMIDFHMRRNEACCVRDGIDPFLVWRGDIRDDRFTPWSFASAKGEHELVRFRRYVHAYPPWEYALMLPFSWMDEREAGSCYMGMMYLALAVLSIIALLAGRRLTGRWWSGCLLLAVVWRFFVPYACCIMYGNFGVIIAALMAVALVFHARGRDALAGIFWTLCFVKPQVAVIALIPLTVLRKWRTLLVIAGGLTVLTLTSAVLCQRSPWEMLVCIREYSANQFNEVALIPKGVFLTLTEEGGIAASTLIMFSSVAVGAVCVLLTLVVVLGLKNIRAENSRCCWVNAVVGFVPALLLSTIWTSSRLHDMSVQSVTAVLLLAIAIVIRDVKVRVISLLLATCVCFQYLDAFGGWSVNVMQVVSVVLLCGWCWVFVKGHVRTNGRC